MELKCLKFLLDLLKILCSNRTFMELKYVCPTIMDNFTAF